MDAPVNLYSIVPLAALWPDLRARAPALDDEWILGLGSGLYFEYFRRPGLSPSHLFIGHNRHLAVDLEEPLAHFEKGEEQRAVREALRRNALAMDLDRAPNNGIMGMELVVDQFDEWESAPDARECAKQAAQEIRETQSLSRRAYVGFMYRAATYLPAADELAAVLAGIADEWDRLCGTFEEIASGSCSAYGESSRRLRRIAMLEEHFWGKVIEAT